MGKEKKSFKEWNNAKKRNTVSKKSDEVMATPNENASENAFL